MGSIHVLSNILANKIAAGEVVERPASVVKELVENALDAHASVIEIELEQAGLDLIRVTDNGTGMVAEDLALSFERHATSKIRNDKDLFRIQSLGFRGEALPSIAAVARVEVKTRTSEEPAGSFLRIEGGSIIEQGSSAAKQGTDMAVKDLFFNTPARLKYLKSIQTELGHSIDYVQRMSLAHPSVAFTLRHQGRVLLQTNGDSDILHVIAAIYGRDAAKQMMRVEWNNYDYVIHGVTGYPELNRANRNHMHFFVNGRYIRSYTMTNALLAAYHTRLPINRFPMSVLNIQMDPSLVDVNVHPTKLEVRFSEEKDVFASIQKAVEAVLAEGTFIPKATARTHQQLNSEQPHLDWNAIRPSPSPESEDKSFESFQRSSESTERSSAGIRTTYTGPEYIRDNRGSIHEKTMEAYQPSTPISREKDEDQVQSVAYRKIPTFRPVTQVLGMYVIAEDEHGLYIIDQHAAHEKVLYERFIKKLNQREILELPLLVPLHIELTAAEAERLEQYIPMLIECKMDVERFGMTSYIVRTVPDIWDGQDITRLAEELITEMLQEGRQQDPRVLIEAKVIQKACKAAIKANHWLSMPEMIALCDQLRELENPYQCPHGRPIIIHMTHYDLEKQFKRVM